MSLKDILKEIFKPNWTKFIFPGVVIILFILTLIPLYQEADFSDKYYCEMREYWTNASFFRYQLIDMNLSKSDFENSSLAVEAENYELTWDNLEEEMEIYIDNNIWKSPSILETNFILFVKTSPFPILPCEYSGESYWSLNQVFDLDNKNCKNYISEETYNCISKNTKRMYTLLGNRTSKPNASNSVADELTWNDRRALRDEYNKFSGFDLCLNIAYFFILGYIFSALVIFGIKKAIYKIKNK